jgi:hypothetical protein
MIGRAREQGGMRVRAALIAMVLAFPAMIFVAAAGAPNAPQQGTIAISGCRTIDQPGAYRLVDNRKAAGNCLVVTAEGVTIDLGGFAISGTGQEPPSSADTRKRRGFHKREPWCGTATSRTSRWRQI